MLTKIRASAVVTSLLSIPAVLYGGLMAIDGLRTVFDVNWSNIDNHGDCRVDWAAASLFWQHRSPYTEDGLAAINMATYGFGHPPTTAFWFLPFTRIASFPILGELLAILTVGLLCVHVLLCTYELDLPAKPAVATLAFGWAVSTSWMVYHAHIVQVSETIAFLYVLAWYFLRRKREVAGGAMLGLACTFKLFPGVMVLFLLLSRRFKGFLAAAVAYLSIAIVMTSRFGLESWRLFLKQQGPIAQYWIGDLWNGSLTGIVVRALRPICEFQVMRSTYPQEKLRELPGTMPPGTNWGYALSLVLLVVAWWAFRNSARDDRDYRAIDAPFAFFSAASAFINPWVWTHYYFVLILPLFILFATACRGVQDMWRTGGPTPGATSVWAICVTLLECSAALLAVMATVHLLNIDVWARERVYRQYWILKNSRVPPSEALHGELHWLEAVNWLPWALTTGTLLLLPVFDLLRRKLWGPVTTLRLAATPATAPSATPNDPAEQACALREVSHPAPGSYP